MPFLEHVIILCDTNNVNKDSPFDNKCKRVDHTLDEEKIKSTIPTWQYVKLVFFSTKIYFRLYSNILNNISIKTHYVTNLYVYLLISLLNCLIWQLMFVFGVPIKYLLVENKFVICIALAFFNRSKCKCVPNSFWSMFFICFEKLFVYLKIFINNFNENGWQSSKQ